LQPYYTRTYGDSGSLPYVTDGRPLIFWRKSVQRITVNERTNDRPSLLYIWKMHCRTCCHSRQIIVLYIQTNILVKIEDIWPSKMDQYEGMKRDFSESMILLRIPSRTRNIRSHSLYELENVIMIYIVTIQEKLSH
jgi:hypothetical protein